MPRGSNNTSSNRHGTHACTHARHTKGLAYASTSVSMKPFICQSTRLLFALKLSTYFTYSNKNSMKAWLCICLPLSFPVHSVMFILHVVKWPYEAHEYSSSHPSSVHNGTLVANATLPTCHLSLVWSSSITQAEAWTKRLARQAISTRRQGYVHREWSGLHRRPVKFVYTGLRFFIEHKYTMCLIRERCTTKDI